MALVKARFRVEGMHCAGCVANLECRLARLPGVHDVSVSLPLKQAVIQYDDSMLSGNQFLDTIEQAGFHGAPDEVDQTIPSFPEASREQSLLRRRFIFSIFLLVPLLVLTMGSMAGIPGLNELRRQENAMMFAMIQFVLSMGIAVVNRKYFAIGLRLLFTGSPNMDTLVALGASTALIYSTILLTIMIVQTSSGQRSTIGVMDLYFESAATILTLITLGRYLESHSRKNTTRALAELVQLAPQTATVVRSGVETTVPNEEVLPGDILVIRPGEKIPVDGHVVEGQSTIDQSSLTGESIPKSVIPGDPVLSATINQEGWFRMRADKVGRDTTLARMIELIRDTAASKAPLAQVADRVCAFFVPTVIGLAFLTVIAWLLAGQTIALALTMMISVLVVSCPCALGLATPLAVMVGTGAGARRGILVKSAAVFEALNRIDTIVLDKTGTVTLGRPRIVDLMAVNGTNEELLGVAGALERFSEHPLSRAILQKANEENIPLKRATDFENIPGRGIVAILDGRTCRVGNEEMMQERHINLDTVQQIVSEWEHEGKTVVFVSQSDKLLGLLAITDPVKPTSRHIGRLYKDRGLKTILLSGDRDGVAQAVGRAIEADQVIAQVQPDEKEALIRSLQEAGQIVAMVGDGINDAPALVRADVGMAIGNGTDIAIDSADLVLTRNNLQDVLEAIELGRDVVCNIRQNLFWAFIYNIIGIPLAAGVFYALGGWKLNPVYAAAAMGFSSLCVVLNTLRLDRKQKRSNNL